MSRGRWTSPPRRARCTPSTNCRFAVSARWTAALWQRVSGPAPFAEIEGSAAQRRFTDGAVNPGEAVGIRSTRRAWIRRPRAGSRRDWAATRSAWRHGLDIARAAHRTWSISREDALLIIPGVFSMAPHYVHPSRGAGLRASFELRMRGGGRYRLAVHRGTAHISAAGDKADCVITADPVAFLLLGYGRIPVGTGRSGQAAARRQKALACSEVRHTAQPPVDLLRRLELLLLVTIPHPVGDALRGDVTAGARTRWSPPCNPFPLISPPRH